MSGYAKRAYNKYICDQKSFFYKIIKDKIIPILPAKYNWTMAYNLLKEYYPLELRAFQFQLDIYKHQDKTLEKIKHKRRYNVIAPTPKRGGSHKPYKGITKASA